LIYAYFGANGLLLRRNTGSRYTLLYQKAIWADTSAPTLRLPTLFWYNAAIEAILHGLNAIRLLFISNVYINSYLSLSKNI